MSLFSILRKAKNLISQVKFTFVVRLSLLIGLFSLWGSTGFAQWEPDRRLTFNDSSSQTSHSNARCIATAPGGLVHVVWYDMRDGNNEIYYKSSTNSGIAWSSDIRLTLDTNASLTPSIAVSDTVVHVVWNDNRDGNSKIYYKRSLDSGLNWSPDFRLTPNGNASYEPSISTSDTLVHVVWTDYRTGKYQIFYKRSTDAGLNWSPDTCLSHDTSYAVTASVTSAASNVFVVWQGFQEGNYKIYYLRSTDGGASWSTDSRLTNGSGSETSSSPALFGPYVHVVWRDTRNMRNDLYYKRSSDYGMTWSADTCLCNAQNDRNDPSVSVSGSNVHAIWSDTRDGPPNWEIYYKRSTNSGFSWSPDVRLTNDANRSIRPSLAVSGPMVHVVWEDNRDGNYEIYYKRNPTGNLGVETPLEPLNISRVMSLKANPNPFVSFTAVPEEENEIFVLYDISGRAIGHYRGHRIGADAVPGVYFIRNDKLFKNKLIRVVKVK